MLIPLRRRVEAVALLEQLFGRIVEEPHAFVRECSERYHGKSDYGEQEGCEFAGHRSISFRVIDIGSISPLSQKRGESVVGQSNRSARRAFHPRLCKQRLKVRWNAAVSFRVLTQPDEDQQPGQGSECQQGDEFAIV